MAGRGQGGNVSKTEAGIPESSRELVQSLKEIVNCSELEIYAVLVECDMDSNEAVSRLLSQDTFQEVKRKKNKTKVVSENITTDPVDSWTSSIPNNEAVSSENSSYKTQETGCVQDMPENKKEKSITPNHWARGASSSHGILRRQPPSNSNTTSSVIKRAPIGSSDGVTFSWADIVKKGLPMPPSSETQESVSKAPLQVDDDDVYASIATGFQKLAIENEEDQEALPKDEEDEVLTPKNLPVRTSASSDFIFGGIDSGQASGLNDNLEDNSTLRQPSDQFDSTARDNYASSDSETESDEQEFLQDVDSFSHNVQQQGYTNSVPNTLLPSGSQDAAENLFFQSLMAPGANMFGYGNTTATPEQQGAAFDQHLPSKGYFYHHGNLIDYSSMPQNYNPYMPSAVQQAHPAGNHQSLAAAMLPQYQTQSTVAHAPPPPPPPSAYWFGGGASSSSNFPLNPAGHLASSLLQQQQNDNALAWHQSHQRNSRVNRGTGYFHPGHQNQQIPANRQTQQLQQLRQPSQQQEHLETYVYPHPCDPQAAMSLENRQHARDASKDSKQTQQHLWPKK